MDVENDSALCLDSDISITETDISFSSQTYEEISTNVEFVSDIFVDLNSISSLILIVAPKLLICF